MSGGGRPGDIHRKAWAESLDLHAHYSKLRVYRILTWGMMEQLSQCRDDSARRIILGISEKMEVKKGVESECLSTIQNTPLKRRSSALSA